MLPGGTMGSLAEGTSPLRTDAGIPAVSYVKDD